jgi:hypothetical protein
MDRVPGVSGTGIAGRRGKPKKSSATDGGASSPWRLTRKRRPGLPVEARAAGARSSARRLSPSCFWPGSASPSCSGPGPLRPRPGFPPSRRQRLRRCPLIPSPSQWSGPRHNRATAGSRSSSRSSQRPCSQGPSPARVRRQPLTLRRKRLPLPSLSPVPA